MDYTFYLMISAILAAFAAWFGGVAAREGQRSPWTLWLMGASFVAQCVFLSHRGELRASCPLNDLGELLAFMAWSMTMFYLLFGSTYRVSLLGVFTAPVVAFIDLLAWVPGMLDEEVVATAVKPDYWGESHKALSVLSYGAFALGAVAAVMFLVLNHFLKSRDTIEGMFTRIAPVHTLLAAMSRLTLVGVLFLTLGLISGWLMHLETGKHMIVAMVVWIGYVVTLGIWYVRGMSPKRMSCVVIALFVSSLAVFVAL